MTPTGPTTTAAARRHSPRSPTARRGTASTASSSARPPTASTTRPACPACSSNPPAVRCTYPHGRRPQRSPGRISRPGIHHQHPIPGASVPVTITAHQLKLLLDKTLDHMGSENVEPLHGIRLDADSQYVYAVATDRYTIAAARYRLDNNDQNQEPWARLIPGDIVPALREWIDTMKGAEYLTISTAKDRLVFDGPLADLTIATNTALEFPD